MKRNWLTVDMYFIDSIRNRTFATRFFDLFECIYPEFNFEFMDESEPLSKKFDLSQAVIEWEKNRGKEQYEHGSHIFLGRKPREFYALIDWYGKGNPGWTDNVSAMICADFWSSEELEDASHKAIELLKGLARLGSALYGKAFISSEWATKGFKDWKVLPGGGSSRESISLTPKQGIIDLYWANYFGRPYVRIFGEESMEKAECPVKEKVQEGVLLVFSRLPSGWEDSKVRALQEKAKAVLNHGVFYDRLADRKPDLNIENAN